MSSEEEERFFTPEEERFFTPEREGYAQKTPPTSPQSLTQWYSEIRNYLFGRDANKNAEKDPESYLQVLINYYRDIIPFGELGQHYFTLLTDNHFVRRGFCIYLMHLPFKSMTEKDIQAIFWLCSNEAKIKIIRAVAKRANFRRVFANFDIEGLLINDDQDLVARELLKNYISREMYCGTIFTATIKIHLKKGIRLKFDYLEWIIKACNLSVPYSGLLDAIGNDLNIIHVDDLNEMIRRRWLSPLDALAIQDGYAYRVGMCFMDDKPDLTEKVQLLDDAVNIKKPEIPELIRAITYLMKKGVDVCLMMKNVRMNFLFQYSSNAFSFSEISPTKLIELTSFLYEHDQSCINEYWDVIDVLLYKNKRDFIRRLFLLRPIVKPIKLLYLILEQFGVRCMFDEMSNLTIIALVGEIRKFVAMHPEEKRNILRFFVRNVQPPPEFLQALINERILNKNDIDRNMLNEAESVEGADMVNNTLEDCQRTNLRYIIQYLKQLAPVPAPILIRVPRRPQLRKGKIPKSER